VCFKRRRGVFKKGYLCEHIENEHGESELVGMAYVAAFGENVVGVPTLEEIEDLTVTTAPFSHPDDVDKDRHHKKHKIREHGATIF
jgi:hypothetical protein